MLLALLVVRAAAFAGPADVPALPLTLALLAVIGLADQAAASVTQALAGELVAPRASASPFMARYRTRDQHRHHARHGAGGDRLAGGDAFGALLAANAVQLPRRGGDRRDAPAHRRPRARARARLLVPSAPTAALMASTA